MKRNCFLFVCLAFLILFSCQTNDITEKKFETQNFIIRVSDVIVVSKKSDPNSYVWKSTDDFLHTHFGYEKVNEKKGMFFIKDVVKNYSSRTEIVNTILNQNKNLIISGIIHGKTIVDFEMKFYEISEARLGFEINYDKSNRIILNYHCEKDEKFVGFGEQFTYINLKGKKVPIFISEQGLGRGEQPVTAVTELVAKAGGSYYTSYACVPYYFTSYKRGLFLKNYEYSEFDLRKKREVSVKIFSNQVEGEILTGDSPYDIINSYTEYSGRMKKLPSWISEGMILGVQGGTDKALNKLQKVLDSGVKVSALWIQDWVGQRTTSFGKQLWWNWTLDDEHYYDWNRFTSFLKKNNIKLLGYINPFLVNSDFGNRRNLFDEAKKFGYLVMENDGSEYMIENTDFEAGLIDLTNPKAVAWIMNVIRDEMISIGFDGWMADFGEAAPYDAKYFNNNIAEHNRYVELWAEANAKAVEGFGDKVFFMRAGFTKSPSYSTMFWLGDQMVSWSEDDGIKSSVTGLLSGGMSGFTLNHSDIGGYTTLSSPIKNYHRSKELLIRWIELNSMGTVFRSHEGNQPDFNYQVYSDKDVLKITAKYSKLFYAFSDYRKELIKNASETGIPPVRHMLIEYPEIDEVWEFRFEQFMFGKDILVAPVLEKGKRIKDVFLPKGEWIDIWTGEKINMEKSDYIKVEADLDHLPVYIKSNSVHIDSLKKI